MLKVRNYAWSLSLELIKRETDGLWIEFGVIQERQLAKKPELTVATSEETREPIWNCNADDPMTAARIENDGVK